MSKSSEGNSEALREALTLARAGRCQAAIALLRQKLTGSLERGDSKWASRLARNIAVICENNGLLNDALSAYEVALVQVPDDGSVAYLLAALHHKMGHTECALQAALRARDLARACGDKELAAACDAIVSGGSEKQD